MITATLWETNRNLSEQLASLLEQHQQSLVLAESCTAGLVAASLARVPGISQWLCGSLVTYQDFAKRNWLGIPPQFLDQYGAVSREVAEAMARRALAKAPEARWGLAVTGHLEPQPDAPQPLCFIAAAHRTTVRVNAFVAEPTLLNEPNRVSRQWEATNAVLQFAISHLQSILNRS